MMLRPLRSRFLSPVPLTALLLLLGGVVYVGNTWSPSSHALALRLFQVPDDGLSAGSPRGIRSDEWAVITPLTQATVNAGLARVNHTSAYQEDLRTTYALPILDWGLAFKPTMWLFPLVNAAYAFSFNHYALIALFVLGYSLLLRRLGARDGEAVLLAVALFFTGFSQHWWTTFGPLLAFFPWALLVFLAPGALPLRLLAFYWVAVCWLLSAFYPPLFLSLVFLAVVLLAAFRPDSLKLRPVLSFGLAGVAAGLTAAFYLRDWLMSTRTTLYPGQRRVGGGSYGLERTLSQLFPSAHIQNHENLIPGANVCELATVGSFYVLMVLCFLNYRGLREGLSPPQRRRIAVIAGGALLLSAWLYLPVPSWLGAPLLWNFIPPPRMAFVSGALWLLLAYVLAAGAGLRVTPLRTALFCASVVGGWLAFKYLPHRIGPLQAWKDLVVILPVLALLAASLAKPLTASQTQLGALAASALVAVVSFGGFNPLQRAWPIFNRPSTPVTQQLDLLARAVGDAPLAVKGFPGATLNGWGYASASHVLTSPQLPRFRKLFPEMPEADFNTVFNRYAHLILTDDWMPSLIQPDAVALPLRAFKAVRQEQRWSEVSAEPKAVGTQRGGYVDQARWDGDDLVLSGWAPWRDLRASQGLEIHANVPLESVSLEHAFRPDVANMLGGPYLLSGFNLRLKLAAARRPTAAELGICVVAVDRDEGTSVQLQNPEGLRDCAAP